jgi:hypothetical protein
MLEMDWSGKVRGSVSAQAFSGPSPDGFRFLRATDHVTVEDWRGHSLGPLAVDPTFYGLPTWAAGDWHDQVVVRADGTSSVVVMNGRVWSP